MSTSSKLLVTGASGNLGRLVVKHLLASGVTNIVAGSRDPSKLSDLANQGVELRAIDFGDPESLATGFEGIDRVLLISTDAVGRPGQRLAQHRAAVDAAVSAGASHLLYTSVTAASADSRSLVTPDHYQTERAISASGIGHTILRNALYFDNLLGAIPGILASGRWFHASAKGKAALVSREDCARIAAAALASDFSGKRILEVTGPELHNRDGLAAILSRHAGKPVQAIALDEDSLVSGLVAAGIPEPYARLLASFDTAQAAGEFDVRTDSVEELTGTPPVSFAEFLRTAVPQP